MEYLNCLVFSKFPKLGQLDNEPLTMQQVFAFRHNRCNTSQHTVRTAQHQCHTKSWFLRVWASPRIESYFGGGPGDDFPSILAPFWAPKMLKMLSRWPSKNDGFQGPNLDTPGAERTCPFGGLISVPGGLQTTKQDCK